MKVLREDYYEEEPLFEKDKIVDEDNIQKQTEKEKEKPQDTRDKTHHDQPNGIDPTQSSTPKTLGNNNILPAPLTFNKNPKIRRPIPVVPTIVPHPNIEYVEMIDTVVENDGQIL